ncbi:hypothetical protein Sm713_28480 [Streptomyces sp. TS71-3]|nr:hypothetical protein Sm713_28480 [Streptomyces sp. TS71-3]
MALPNNTGKKANTLVVRTSIPDTPQGGGTDASLDLYVNGTFRQAITLSSRQAWNYRHATTNPDDPDAGGMPYRFYNDFPIWVEGAPIAPGSTIELRKDAANTAAVYDIDSVDLTPAARRRRRRRPVPVRAARRRSPLARRRDGLCPPRRSGGPRPPAGGHVLDAQPRPPRQLADPRRRRSRRRPHRARRHRPAHEKRLATSSAGRRHAHLWS